MTIKSVSKNIVNFVTEKVALASNAVQSKVSKAYQFVFKKDQPSPSTPPIYEPAKRLQRDIVLSEKRAKEESRRSSRGVHFMRRNINFKAEKQALLKRHENKAIVENLLSKVPVEGFPPLPNDIIHLVLAQLDLPELIKVRNPAAHSNEVWLEIANQLGFSLDDFKETPNQALADIPPIENQLHEYQTFLAAHLISPPPSSFTKESLYQLKRASDAQVICAVTLQLATRLSLPVDYSIESNGKGHEKAAEWLLQNQSLIKEHLKTHPLSLIEGYPIPPLVRSLL